MSEFDNLYLCPRCENIDSLHTNDMVCDNCGYESCFVAKHINEGIRKHWSNIESKGGAWRREKRVSSIVKKHTPSDKKITKKFHKLATYMFEFLNNNKNDMHEIFPKFTRDYKRTTGERETGWKDFRSATKINRDSARGILYEGAFNRAYENHDAFERIIEPITIVNDDQEEKYFEPDSWVLLDGYRIPVEFKTYKKGGLVKSKFLKGLRQSRRYGKLSSLMGDNPLQYSGLIICCPEERKFASVLMDSRIERIL